MSADGAGVTLRDNETLSGDADKPEDLSRREDIGTTKSASRPRGSAPTLPVATSSVPKREWHAGDRISRYELRGVIGSGGMGVVWSAWDTALDWEVAIKVIRSTDWPEPSQHLRLLGEARAMARLSHRNVVTVHDIGTADGNLFVAMERVDGGTLREWLRAAPRSWGEVTNKFIAAGRGLAEAHRAGLVHRDFKPDNVLMGQDGAPRVSDFGLALPFDRSRPTPHGSDAAEAAVSQRGDLVGTLDYMSPEQLLGEKLTTRSDQFGFCVSLYEGLFAVKPFSPIVDRAIRAPFFGDSARTANGDAPREVERARAPAGGRDSRPLV